MNIKDIKAIFDLFENSKASKVEIQEDNLRIFLEKGVDNNINTLSNNVEPVVINKPKEVEIIEESKSSNHLVKAPLVGTFYRSPSPDEKPFVEIGDQVTIGQTLCIVEAMKMLNEIKSSVKGKVVSIFPENDTLVEFDANLIEIEED